MRRCSHCFISTFLLLVVWFGFCCQDALWSLNVLDSDDKLWPMLEQWAGLFRLTLPIKCGRIIALLVVRDVCDPLTFYSSTSCFPSRAYDMLICLIYVPSRNGHKLQAFQRAHKSVQKRWVFRRAESSGVCLSVCVCMAVARRRLTPSQTEIGRLHLTRWSNCVQRIWDMVAAEWPPSHHHKIALLSYYY